MILQQLNNLSRYTLSSEIYFLEVRSKLPLFFQTFDVGVLEGVVGDNLK